MNAMQRRNEERIDQMAEVQRQIGTLLDLDYPKKNIAEITGVTVNCVNAWIRGDYLPHQKSRDELTTTLAMNSKKPTQPPSEAREETQGDLPLSLPSQPPEPILDDVTPRPRYSYEGKNLLGWLSDKTKEMLADEIRGLLPKPLYMMAGDEIIFEELHLSKCKKGEKADNLRPSLVIGATTVIDQQHAIITGLRADLTRTTEAWEKIAQNWKYRAEELDDEVAGLKDGIDILQITESRLQKERNDALAEVGRLRDAFKRDVRDQTKHKQALVNEASSDAAKMKSERNDALCERDAANECLATANDTITNLQGDIDDLNARLDNQRRIANANEWWHSRAQQLELAIAEHDDLEVPEIPADLTAPTLAQSGD